MEHQSSLWGKVAKIATIAGIAAGSVAACGYTPNTPVPEKSYSSKVTDTTPTIKQTAIPTMTENPVPTVTSTEAATATAAATHIDEKDLHPAYTEKVYQKYLGVQIDAELTTDESLSSNIKKVTVPENVYAEFIARALFKVWWNKGTEAPSKMIASEDDFRAFMADWAKAQETNDPNDWKKVQIDNIWANDLDDGNGYIQKPYSIWPMYRGGAVDKILAIKDVNIILGSTDPPPFVGPVVMWMFQPQRIAAGMPD